MSKTRRVLGHWHDRAGYRGRFLGLLALADVLYGVALIQARTSQVTAQWWPGYLKSLAMVPVAWWGVIWIGVGIYVASGVMRRSDDVQYMAATLLNAVWAVLVVNWWWLHRDVQAGSWALGVVWAGIATASYLVSLWPEPKE